MLGSIDSNSREWPQNFLYFSLTYYFSSEHKPLFMPIRLYFIKRHVWRVKMFHKTVHKAWNLFKLSEQSQKNSAEKSCFMIFDRKVTFNRSSALFDRTNKNQAVIETSRDSKIFFFTISIDRAKVSTDQKRCISNFHLENSRTWIFILWNNILQTHTSLLQPIHVYTYIYNIINKNFISLITKKQCYILFSYQ